MQIEVGHGHKIPEPGMLGYLGAIRMNSARVVLKTSPLAQDGYWWEGIWVQVLPWQTDCIIVHIGGLALAIQVEAVVVEPGGKNRTTWGWCHQKHIA